MKTVLIIAGVGVGLFVLYRVGTAAAAGAPIVASIRRPTVPVTALAAVAAAETKSNSGAGHF